MRMSAKGQVTIPAALRKQAGLKPDCEIDIVCENGQLVLKKHGSRKNRGDIAIDLLRGKGTVKLSTDEIMAMTRGEE